MNVKDIIDIMNKSIPLDSQMSWDNSGLIVGGENEVVNKVLFALDPVTPVLNEALRNNCELIITHHPIMFSGVKKITHNSYDGKIVATLLENKLNLCSMHTNLDYYEKGPGKIVAGLLKLTDKKLLVAHEKYEKLGIGVIGNLPFAVPLSLESLAEYVKNSLHAESVRIAGNANADVHRVAVVAGSGSEYINEAINQGADVLVTGDVKYHRAIDAVERGLHLIDVGHFDMEKFVIDIFEKMLASELQKNGVTCIKSKQRNIFRTI